MTSNEKIEQKILELQSCLKTLQSVGFQIATVANIAKRVLNNRKHESSTTYIDPLPDAYTVGTLRTANPVETVEVVSNIRVPIKTVANVSEIPTSHLYYVEDTKQFAINVEGIILKGNLCNISEYQEKQSARCEYGIDCKSFKTKECCDYYHDPGDYLHHGMLIPDVDRNFTVGSWIYSKNKYPRTYYARHLGDKARLKYDLNTLNRVQYRDEIFNREGQLVHDLLIYMVLNSKNLLEKYKKWKHMPSINI